MANLFTDTTNYVSIANAIRSVKGVSTQYLPSEMSNAIRTFNPAKIAWRSGQKITGALENFDMSWIDISNASSLQSMLQQNSFTSLDLSSWDFTNVTNMNYFCNSCSNLVSIDFGTQSDITCSIIQSFRSCSSLKTIDLSWIYFSGGNSADTFRDCSSLESVNIFKINSNSTINVANTFTGCSSLTSLDLSGWVSTGTFRMYELFRGCTSLQHIDMSNIDFTQCDNYAYAFWDVPNNCEILVKDQASKDWFATNISNLTNVQIKA